MGLAIPTFLTVVASIAILWVSGLNPRHPFFAILGATIFACGFITLFTVPIAIYRLVSKQNASTLPNLILTALGFIPFGLLLLLYVGATDT